MTSSPLVRAAVRTAMVVAALTGGASIARANDLYADLDRDGVRDRVSIQNQSGPTLVVQLSASKSLFRLRTVRPIVSVAAADLDGDGRVEIIAADSSAGLHVWRRTLTGRLRPFRPRPLKPTAGTPRHGHFSDPQDADGQGVETERDATPSCDVTSLPVVPSLDVLIRSTRRAAIDLRSACPTPQQPRAPPRHA